MVQPNRPIGYFCHVPERGTVAAGWSRGSGLEHMALELHDGRPVGENDFLTSMPAGGPDSIEPQLRKERLARFVGGIGSLPSLPSLYLQLTEELRSPDVSPARVSRIIAKDLAMTSKILQIVNSAYFGISRQVSSVERAILLLGMEMVRTFVLSVEVFSMFEPKKLAGLTVAGLWRHSMNCSAIARRISASEGLSRMVQDHVGTAAFLHDIGKLMMSNEKPELYREVTRLSREERIPVFLAEQSVYGFDHAEAGGYLLQQWQLPASVVEAVTWHHNPVGRGGSGLTPLAIIHASNYLEHLVVMDEQSENELCQEYVGSLEPAPDLEGWKELAQSAI
jgi:putative nucleotidyltransferase with HDIG domain